MNKILIIQAARFGDLLQSKRLILSLARSHEIHLALDQSLVPLAAIIYPQLKLHGIYFHGQPNDEKIAHNSRTLNELRHIPFQQIYNCNFSRLTAAICRLFPVEKIIGYRPDHASDGGIVRSSWSRLAFRLASMRAVSPLNLVDFWAWFAPDPMAPEKVNPIARPGGKGLAIAVAGRDERRSIPPQVLAQGAAALFQLLKSPPIILLGTAAEAPRARALQRHFTAPMLAQTRDLCGHTDWPQLLQTMAGLDCLLTPDTGLMHLAAHLGVPVLACFLSSAWLHETGPYGLGHKIIQAAPPCAPCLEAAPCGHNLACHAPWQKNFARAAALAWNGGNQTSWPDGLQLWETALDNLGAAPQLLAGADGGAERRAIARNIIMNKLHLAPMAETNLEERARLLRELDPAGDFMLPPGRYC